MPPRPTKLAQQALDARLCRMRHAAWRGPSRYHWQGEIEAARRNPDALQNQHRPQRGASSGSLSRIIPTTHPKFSRGRRRLAALRPVGHCGNITSSSCLTSSDFVARRHALRAVVYLLRVVFVLFGASSAARAADDFLDPAVAFKFSATENDPAKSTCATRSRTGITCIASDSPSRRQRHDHDRRPAIAGRQRQVRSDVQQERRDVSR